MTPLLVVLENLGVFAFAISGMLTARRRKMDLVGVYTVAFVTAFGGGTLRDLLIDRRPFYWVEFSSYALVIFVGAMVSFLIVDPRRGELIERLNTVPDALGLGLFTASGVAHALDAGLSPFLVVMMGVLTATFGGVLRDVLCNEVPVVFQRTQLYATCAFIGGWVYLASMCLIGDRFTSLVLCLAVTVLLRLVAVRFDLRLPA